MVERGSGHVVLIGSMSGKIPAAYGSVYSATKFGLRGFGLSLADELHGTGVGVSLVSPGFISEAGMYAKSGVKLPAGAGTKKPEHVVRAVVAAIEKGRLESDVAPASFRAGGRLYGVAPGLITAIQRRWGSHDVAKALADSQADER
jgi:short-subunit dehydrogenase